MVNLPHENNLMLLAQPAFRKQDFSQVKCCMSGAASFPVYGIKDLESLVGACKMIEGWGMTEKSLLITVNPALSKKKLGSVDK